MATYANQKTITINREEVNLRGDKQYLAVYSENVAAASRVLSNTSFKLYIYLLSNQDGYKKDFSSQHFATLYGVSYSSVSRAIAELERERFLVKSDNNKYEFYELPQKELEFAIAQERRKFKMTNGSFVCLTYEEFLEEANNKKYPQEQIAYIWNKGEVVE